jgi:type IV secretion system protein VirD4
MFWHFLFPKKPDTYGSATLLNDHKRAFRKLLSPYHDGLVVDGANRLDRDNSYRHMAVVGSSGSGKTQSFILPNILSLEKSSMLITDPSGELLQMTKDHLKGRGYQVKVVSCDPRVQGLQFNPLYRATDHTEQMQVAEIIVRSGKKQPSADSVFWDDGAAELGAVLIQSACRSGSGQNHLGTVWEMANRFIADREGLERQLAATLDAVVWDSYKAFAMQDGKVSLGMASTLKTALRKFSDGHVRWMLSAETLHFESMRHERTALFVTVPEHRGSFYSAVTNLLYYQVFAFAMESGGHGQLPLFMLLDEFGNNHIPYFSEQLTCLRKREVSVSIVLQDILQLRAAYGMETAGTILNGGCCSKLFCPGGLSQETAEYLERVFGTETRMVREEGYGQHGGDSPSRPREVGRSLRTAQEIRTMGRQSIFVSGYHRPALLDAVPAYRNPRYRHLLPKR